MPRLAKVFAQDRAAPARVSYRSIEKTWREWGWRVATRRTAEHAWSGLEKASAGGFTLTGGRAVVTTPGDHRPGRAYVLRYRAGTGPATGGRGRARAAAGAGDPVRERPGPGHRQSSGRSGASTNSVNFRCRSRASHSWLVSSRQLDSSTR